MNLRLLFALMALMTSAAGAVVMYLSFGINPRLFYGAEAWVIVMFMLWIYFYRKAIAPYKVLRDGGDLLRGGDWNVRLRSVSQPEADSIVAVFNDMMERLHRQEVRLNEQSHFLALLAEAAPVGIVATDSTGRIMMCNGCASAWLGVRADGLTLDSIDHPLSKAMAALADGSECTVRTAPMELRLIHRGHFVEHGVRRSFYVISDMAEAVADAEREAYGKLVRTIAHEVNNSMGAIVTAMGVVETNEADAHLLAACRDRAMGLSEFVGAYAGVVKTGNPRLAEVSLRKLVERLCPLLESMCTAAGVTFGIDATDSDIEVMADAAQIEQVLVNVVKNAVESCQDKGNVGEVRIKVDGSALVVSDNGAGLDPEAAGNVFSPFFTTKPYGRGIGLTLVREILTRHRCDFSLSTDPDGLTHFRLHFADAGVRAR